MAPEPAGRGGPATPDLQVVGDRPARRRGLLGTLLVGLLFALLFTVAAFQTFLVKNQFQLDDLNDAVSSERAVLQELEADVAGLESPERIAEAAREGGLVPAGDDRSLVPDAATAAAIRRALEGTAAEPDSDSAALPESSGR